MFALTLITMIVLAVLAILHLMWALKIWWPIADEQALTRAIAGAPGIARMPPFAASFAVAVALFSAMILVGILGGILWLPIPVTWVRFCGYILAAVFLLRGLVGYTAFWAKIWPEEPFRTLDRRYYSPLCILLGVAVVVLLSQ